MAVRVFVVKHFGVTHHPRPQRPFSHSAWLTVLSLGQVGGKMSTRGFRFSKIHTSLLYLTGNYMEMWHNGEQASGVTIAAGATEPRATEQRASSSLPSSALAPASQDKNVMFEREFLCCAGLRWPTPHQSPAPSRPQSAV